MPEHTVTIANTATSNVGITPTYTASPTPSPSVGSKFGNRVILATAAIIIAGGVSYFFQGKKPVEPATAPVAVEAVVPEPEPEVVIVKPRPDAPWVTPSDPSPPSQPVSPPVAPSQPVPEPIAEPAPDPLPPLSVLPPSKPDVVVQPKPRPKAVRKLLLIPRNYCDPDVIAARNIAYWSAWTAYYAGFPVDPHDLYPRVLKRCQ